MRDKIDLARYPHVYTGPSTPWGLASGEPCRIIGNRGGGKIIRVDGYKKSSSTFIVATSHVRRASEVVSA